MKMDLRLRRFADRAALNEALTERLAWEIEQPRRGSSALMLAGGNTPLVSYHALAGRRLTPSPKLEVLYSDERYVPATSDASNFHGTRALLESLGLPPERILRVRTELPLERAVEDYERRLRALQRTETRITLGLLGLGADGHTASLFSDGDLKRSTGRLAISVERPDGRSAISVTPELLSQVAEVLFVVAGSDKRTALKALLDRKAESIAARAIGGCANVEIWADRDSCPAGT